MKIVIDEKKLEKNGLSLTDYLYLLLQREYFKRDECDSIVYKRLVKNNIITRNLEFTKDGSKIFKKINKKADCSDDRDLTDLIKQLQWLWPSGYKDGKWKWRSNETDVEKKLNKFFVEYGNGFTDQQIIDAASLYVKRFDESGDRTYQKILKYFIIGQDGESSLLADNLDAIEKNEQPGHFFDVSLF